MEKLTGVTFDECQYACSNTAGCLGIEFFKMSYSRNASNLYKKGDCNLSDSLNTVGCDPHKWQMYLWKKGWAVSCNDWRREHKPQSGRRPTKDRNAERKMTREEIRAKS